MGVIKKPKSPHIFHLSPIMQQKWSPKKKTTTRIECKSSLHSFCLFKGNPSHTKKKVQRFKVLMPKE
jgi:hypothetical protein